MLYNFYSQIAPKLRRSQVLCRSATLDILWPFFIKLQNLGRVCNGEYFWAGSNFSRSETLLNDSCATCQEKVPADQKFSSPYNYNFAASKGRRRTSIMEWRRTTQLKACYLQNVQFLGGDSRSYSIYSKIKLQL